MAEEDRIEPPRLALVTGASGFVGAAVARHLLQKGIKVRLLTRPTSNRGNLAGLEAEIVTGDLTDPASLESALQGCDALFHVAADYRLWVPDPAAMYAANVDGSVALFRAAHRAGVRRMVYTSSVATLGHPPAGQSADENTPSALDDMIGHYKRSKFLAEEAVQRLVREEHLPIVIVNPSAPMGPRDIKPTPTGQMIVMAMHNRMPAYLNTGLNIVHVDDCAAGHWLAYEKGVIGERYILGGDNLYLREILTTVAYITGARPPAFELRASWLWPVALGMELAARLTDYQPMLTTDTLRMAKYQMFYSSSKAQRDLGYAPRPAQQAIADAIEWFRAQHY